MGISEWRGVCECKNHAWGHVQVPYWSWIALRIDQHEEYYISAQSQSTFIFNIIISSLQVIGHALGSGVLCLLGFLLPLVLKESLSFPVTPFRSHHQVTNVSVR